MERISVNFKNSVPMPQTLCIMFENEGNVQAMLNQSLKAIKTVLKIFHEHTSPFSTMSISTVGWRTGFDMFNQDTFLKIFTHCYETKADGKFVKWNTIELL